MTTASHIMLRLFVLIALLFQGYLTQAHFHGDAAADETGRVLNAAEFTQHALGGGPVVQAADDRQSTDAHDEACPVCQVLALGSHGLVPAEAMAPIVPDSAAGQSFARIEPSTGTPAHRWQSRAPPAA